MAALTGVLTVDDVRRLTEPADGTYYELHYGELVRLTIPKKSHQMRQNRIADVLKQLAGNRGVVLVELGFRALPEHEARRADVGFLSTERYNALLDEDDFFGAPDLVVEVLSRSNTAAEMDDKEKLCFANGCREFWQVNDDRKTIRVTRTGAPVQWYGLTDTIESGTLGASIPVADLFA